MIRHLTFKHCLILFVMFCIIGTTLEWCYGAFWDIVGNTPWKYPNSFLHYTSLEGIPLWGVGGLIAILIYKAVNCRTARPLFLIIPLLAFDVLYIVIYSWLA